MSNPVYLEAKKLWSAGLDVVPIHPETKRPMVKWSGKKRAERLTEAEVDKWWNKRKPPGLGVVLGPYDFIIDLDSKEAIDKLGPELREITRCHKTPRGGIHAWFLSQTPTEKHQIPGVDVLGAGNISVIPPTPGREYVNDLPIMRVPDMMAFVNDLCDRHGLHKVTERGAAAFLEAQKIQGGQRHHGLLSIAGLHRKLGYREGKLRALVGMWARDLCDPPLEDPDEIDNIVRWASDQTPEPLELPEEGELKEYGPALEAPPLIWLVRNFLPQEGVTLIYGGGGTGKSYVAMALTLAIQTGTPFLDELDVNNPGPILYCDWERRGKSFERRLVALCRGLGIPVPPVVKYQPERPLPDSIETLRAIALTRDIRLIVVDSLTISLMGLDVQSEKDVIPQMFRINSLPCPVLALDHQRKAGAKDSGYWGATAFGSIFKQNIASNVWQIGRSDRNRREDFMELQLRHEKGNFERAFSDLLLTLSFEFDEGENLTVARLTKRFERNAFEKVVERVRRSGEATAKEIASAENLERATVLKELSKAQQMGWIRNVSAPGLEGNYIWEQPEDDEEITV